MVTFVIIGRVLLSFKIIRRRLTAKSVWREKMTCFSCATPHRHHLPLPPSTSKSLLRFPSSYLKPSPSLLFHGSSRSLLSCSDGSNNGPPPSGDTVPKQVLPLILLLLMNSMFHLRISHGFGQIDIYCFRISARLVMILEFRNDIRKWEAL